MAAAELLGVDARGHEQAIDAEGGGALEVGAHRIADRQQAMVLHRAPARGFGKGQRLFVDRPIGLAGVDHLAARGRVRIGDRTGAIDELVAALDHHVGIGADHRQRTRAHARDDIAVVVRRLHGVVVKPGADRVVGVLQRRRRRVEPFEQRHIPLGADVEHARSGARGDERAGDVARTHDAVVGRARHAQPVERLTRHPLARPRRVGDEHDRAAALAEARECIASIGRGGDAVVDDAPDVAQHDVVVAGERGEVRGERGEHNRHGISGRGGRTE